ncbi:J domain-containing protein [Synechococcus sp. PCC 6312]|uniref:J domain-containing protein n=1 Tax=Synechococcus sp. (strain ATCC 27167 / PCC 6312) TaxID=195253 RepID=UPI00029F0800|nr:J domain-containing protein [Synechococcus sp. PCC 6312]AFY62511.1 DnaJ-class molecular chaperone with C-terminal Zn finger domain [Synechococcus sp. PCC 6312]
MATSSKKLTPRIEAEISRLSGVLSCDPKILSDFAYFVKGIKPPPPPKPKALTFPRLKAAVYKHFNVTTTLELKESGNFQMATNGMKLNLGKKEAWEDIYRKWIGILPNEEGETGKDCINGINIFKYDLPWRVFGLDRHTATEAEIKETYRNLSKKYHPDNPETGDDRIFQRINIFYRSLLGNG